MKFIPKTAVLIAILSISVLSECLGQRDFYIGANAGIYSQLLQVEGPGIRIKKAPIGFFGSIRFAGSISKRLKKLQIQSDLSYRFRNFKDEGNGSNRIEIAEREIQLRPIFSIELPSKEEAKWVGKFIGGFDANFALKRTINNEALTSFQDLFGTNVVLGTGIKHKESNFFTDALVSYGFITPKNSTNNIQTKWLPFAFNLNVGFMFKVGK